MLYRDFIGEVFQATDPQTYVEIGIRKGDVLRLARCAAIGIDPAPQTPADIEENIRVFTKTSDDFFTDHDLIEEFGGKRVDLAFIDGWHNFEFALRDFMNLEANSHFSTLIIVDDVKPRNAAEAGRRPTGGAWTGDIYKLYYCLKRYRSDLAIHLVDTLPTGLMIVSALDLGNTVLKESYAQIEREYVAHYPDLLPPPGHDDLFIAPSVALRFAELCGLRDGRSSARAVREWHPEHDHRSDALHAPAESKVRFAWWKPPSHGVPADHCPVPFEDWQSVPGMEPWILVHLLEPTERARLPAGLVAAQRVVSLLRNETGDDAVPDAPRPDEDELLESDIKPRHF